MFTGMTSYHKPNGWISVKDSLPNTSRYDLKNKEKWDKAVFSVVYLHIHDILTDSRYDECLNRIMKKSKIDWIKSEEEK